MKDYSQIEAITVAYSQMIYDKAYEQGLKDGIEQRADLNEQHQKDICLTCRYFSTYEKCMSCSRLIREDKFEVKNDMV